MLNKDNDDKFADSHLEGVIDALESQDKDALQMMFSDQALDDANDFENNMGNLFEFFQSGVVTWEKLMDPQFMNQITMDIKLKKSVHIIT
ncbi:DUF5104 domain-containing protein [Anaerocolumna aminovalerica]|uniref:DUF5104 domain-containing protein n=1 Tax=Anaerocolumna aminovalerica TaxID=1527 RepID=UPI001C0EF893|nr:DUF5104 domain-containing protein [Anaerocolumna aminovalerica]MBU5334381.1 DUF5104 domain-containing protein [Anaerocolumna aminovalerica]